MEQKSVLITAAVVVGVLAVPAFIAPAITGNAVANLSRADAGLVRPLLLALCLVAFIAFNNLFKGKVEENE